MDIHNRLVQKFLNSFVLWDGILAVGICIVDTSIFRHTIMFCFAYFNLEVCMLEVLASCNIFHLSETGINTLREIES